MTDGFDLDDLEPDFEDARGIVSWGVEIELSRNEKSIFRAAQRVILDDTCVRIQLENGACEAYPIDNVRKILSMRAEPRPRYTDEELSADEIY